MSETSKRPGTGIKSVLHVAAGLLLCLIATSCTVLETVSVRDEEGYGCRTATGAYFLPKKYLHLQVLESAGGESAKFYQLKLVGTTPEADREQMFCLDFLGSPTSDDYIEVERTEKGLLKQVKSTTTDRSKEIVLKIVDIGLIAATGNPDFTIGRSQFRDDAGAKLIADLNFDPFDRRRMAEVNSTLKIYGYCVLVDRHTIDPLALSVQRYCDNPGRYAYDRMSYVKAPALPVIEHEEGRRGILYRAEKTHEIVVMRRRDPGNRGPWEIFQTSQIEMPNISPVFSIAVDRSFFVTRKTTLVFAHGVLQDVQIEKPSEMLAFSELPLRIAQAIVKVPAEVFKVRIAATNNRARVIDAHTKLLSSQRDYFDALASLQRVRQQSSDNSLPPGAFQSAEMPADSTRINSQCNAYCMSTSPGQSDCMEVCRSKAGHCAGANFMQCITEAMATQ